MCLAGGVAQNSVANGKILENTPFKNLYIPSAGHDAGISMGAAQYYYFNNFNSERKEALYNANLGISFNNNQFKDILIKKGLEFEFYDDKKLFIYLAKKLPMKKLLVFLMVELNLDLEL